MVWAHAQIYASVNNIPMIAPRWARARRSIFRFNGHPRLYLHHFSKRNQVRGLGRLAVLLTYPRVVEPPMDQPAEQKRVVYVFNRLRHSSDYFRDIRPHRRLIIRELHAMLPAARRRELECLSPPVIGVHVRRGDFRVPAPGQNILTEAHMQFPLSYFIERVSAIRLVAGAELPVTVFSDGATEELADLLALPGVSRSLAPNDITELLNLGRSRVIVPSPSSTFSFWAAFLSTAAVIYHPGRMPVATRPSDFNRNHFEGMPPLDPADWPPQLVRYLQSLGTAHPRDVETHGGRQRACHPLADTLLPVEVAHE